MVLEYEKIKVGNKNITLKIVRQIDGGSIDNTCKIIINKLSELRVMGVRKIDLIKNTNIIKIECFLTITLSRSRMKNYVSGLK